MVRAVLSVLFVGIGGALAIYSGSPKAGQEGADSYSEPPMVSLDFGLSETRMVALAWLTSFQNVVKV